MCLKIYPLYLLLSEYIVFCVSNLPYGVIFLLFCKVFCISFNSGLSTYLSKNSFSWKIFSLVIKFYRSSYFFLSTLKVFSFISFEKSFLCYILSLKVASFFLATIRNIFLPLLFNRFTKYGFVYICFLAWYSQNFLRL